MAKESAKKKSASASPAKKTGAKKKTVRKNENKTVPVDKTPGQVLAAVKDDQKRKDCRALVRLIGDVTGKKPRVWGGSIIGFGEYHYKYASGREGDFFIAGFSPRVQNITLYIMSGFAGEADLMRKLGKHKTGKSCLYINSLEDVDQDILRRLITKSVAFMRANYECK